MYMFLLSFVFFGFVSTIIYISFTHKRNKKLPLPLPPGKLGWPVIGETPAFYSSGVKNCHRNFFIDRMKKHSSVVFKTSLLGEKMAVICGPIGNKFVFFNDKNLLRSWVPPTVSQIFSAGDPNSSSFVSSIRVKFRQALSEVLKMDAIHDYVPIIHSMVNQHLETEWCPNEIVKVFHLAEQLTFSLACKLFVGLEDPEKVDKIRSYYADLTAGLFSLPVDLPGTGLNRGIKAAKAIHKEMLPIIKQKRENGKGEKSDLLSRLLTIRDEDGELISDEHIAFQIIGLLVASQDNTTSVITSAVYYLADHPHIYNRVLQEQMEIFKSKESKETLKWEDTRKMKYSRNVVNEVLRIASPSVGLFKEVLSDLSFAGYTIPKGWKVFWSVHTTHENSDYFQDPEKFDPSRFEGNGPLPFTFTAFGGGSSMCPGSEFARIEIMIFLHCLVTRFRWKKLIPDEQLTSIMSPEPVHGLPIQLFPHKQ